MAGTFTREQYERLLGKALTEGLRLYKRAGSNVALFNTEQDGTGYTVAPQFCTCRGHSYHGRCYHRAYVVFRLGLERRYVPEVAAARDGLKAAQPGAAALSA